MEMSLKNNIILQFMEEENYMVEIYVKHNLKETYFNDSPL